MSETPLLRVEALSVRSSERVLLRDITFTLRPGESLTLLGESGAGKSLLAQAVMGALPASLHASGDVWVGADRSDANDRLARRRAWGRRLSLLPQEPMQALDALSTLFSQTVRLRRTVAGESIEVARSKAEGALRDAGLGAAGARHPWQVSGGMAQRAAAMLAGIGGADVLLADEPTKGLDARWRDHVVDALRAVRDGGGCVVVITHDLRVARGLAGRVMVLRAGELVEAGPAEVVLDAPAHAFTRDLLAADPARWPARAAPSFGDEVVRADGLTKSFDGRALFEDLSVRLRERERIAIQGPSGSGKSTFGNILLGLMDPDRGTVVRAGPARVGDFQKLYQDPVGAFAPRRSLDDALGDVARRHRLPRASILRHLEALGVPESLLARRPAEVSGGELQRVAMARALAVRPTFLFADEPTSRLDPITQREAIGLLLDAAQEHGFGMVLVTHDDDLAAAVGHRTLRFDAA